MSVDIPDVWLSFDGNGRDFPVNVRHISVSYDSSATTWSSSGPIMATLPGLKTVLTLECEVCPPAADWNALIVGGEPAYMGKFRSLGSDLMFIRVVVPSGEPPMVTDIRWEPSITSRYLVP